MTSWWRRCCCCCRNRGRHDYDETDVKKVDGSDDTDERTPLLGSQKKGEDECPEWRTAQVGATGTTNNDNDQITQPTCAKEGAVVPTPSYQEEEGIQPRKEGAQAGSTSHSTTMINTDTKPSDKTQHPANENLENSNEFTDPIPYPDVVLLTHSSPQTRDDSKHSTKDTPAASEGPQTKTNTVGPRPKDPKDTTDSAKNESSEPEETIPKVDHGPGKRFYYLVSQVTEDHEGVNVDPEAGLEPDVFESLSQSPASDKDELWQSCHDYLTSESV